MVRRGILVLALALLVAVPALADITLRPGIAFMGSYEPSVTAETFVADTLSAKLFVTGGEEPSFVLSLRQWPDLASFDVGANSLPVYVGAGVVTKGMDGQYAAGIYAEAGFRFGQLFDVGFAVTQVGPWGSVMLNIGLSFDLKVPTGPEPSGI